MSLIAARITDKEVLRLIRRFLQAGIMEAGVIQSRDEGTPQGSPLSPLLSNIMLNELEFRGHKFVRYADDFNAYVKSEVAGKRVLCSIEYWLSKNLRLQINSEKGGVERAKDHSFLGFTFYNFKGYKPRIGKEPLRKLKMKIRSKNRYWR